MTKTNSTEDTKSDPVADPMQYLKEKQIDFEEKVAIDAMLVTTSHTLQGVVRQSLSRIKVPQSYKSMKRICSY